MLVWVIVACEVGFWVLLTTGLVARYGLRLPRLSAAILVCVPLIDLVLLAATTIDLSRGAVATAAHGLAAAYIGFSLIFGHSTIRSLDRRVARRFAGTPPPEKVTVRGSEAVRREVREWLRALSAWAIACALLTAAIVIVGDPSRTVELTSWIEWLSVALIGWLFLGPGWALIVGPVVQRLHR